MREIQGRRLVGQLPRRLGAQIGKDKKATVLYQALVLEGKYPYQPGYLAVFRVDDKASGLEVGTFRWFKTEDSEGSEMRAERVAANGRRRRPSRSAGCRLRGGPCRPRGHAGLEKRRRAPPRGA